jgi:hypothetical protein
MAEENPNKRRITPRRQIALSGDLWDRLGLLVGDRGRSEVIRALVAWYLREPGAKLPERPPRKD